MGSTGLEIFEKNPPLPVGPEGGGKIFEKIPPPQAFLIGPPYGKPGGKIFEKNPPPYP